MKFYTADLHLDHENMIGYCDRPFHDIQEMNEVLIRNINETISDDDDLYILGDFTLRTKRSVVTEFANMLRGRVHLVAGNHDYFAGAAWAKDIFVSIDWYKEIHDNGKKVILSHYPIYAWHGKNKGAYHLFGHVHRQLSPYYTWANAFNVGVDVQDYKPVTLAQLIGEEEK